MKKLVFIPAWNEQDSIEAVIGDVREHLPGTDLLVVDDGSTDETVAIARSLGASVVSHGQNLGVGAALQSGVAEATRRGVDIAVNIDSDGQFAPEDIREAVISRTAGTVTKEFVVVRTTEQDVGACITGDRVISFRTFKCVLACSTRDRVIPRQGEHAVVTLAGSDGV